MQISLDWTAGGGFEQKKWVSNQCARTLHSGAVWKKKFQKSCLKPIFNEKKNFKRILRVFDL